MWLVTPCAAGEYSLAIYQLLFVLKYRTKPMPMEGHGSTSSPSGRNCVFEVLENLANVSRDEVLADLYPRHTLLAGHLNYREVKVRQLLHPLSCPGVLAFEDDGPDLPLDEEVRLTKPWTVGIAVAPP